MTQSATKKRTHHSARKNHHAGDVITKLLKLGQKQRYVTYEQINDLLPEGAVITHLVEEIIHALTAQSVEVVSSTETRRDAILKREMLLRRKKDESLDVNKDD